MGSPRLVNGAQRALQAKSFRPLVRLQLRRALLARFAGRRAKPGVRVLAYHGLPSPAMFRSHIETICSMADLIDETTFLNSLSSPPAPLDRCAVLLTFDDGYRSSVDKTARAIARDYGLRPTVFALASIVEPRFGAPRRLIRDERRNPYPLCTKSDLEQVLADGWSIGSHTATHWDCGRGDAADFEREIAGSKAALEANLGTRVRTFAFPWGGRVNTSEDAAEWLRRSAYEASFTTRRGLVDFEAPEAPYLLPRDVAESWWGPREVAGCLAGALDVASSHWHRIGRQPESPSFLGKLRQMYG